MVMNTQNKMHSPELQNIKGDIRAEKSMLRAKYKTIKTQLPPDEKRKRDDYIFNRLISFSHYHSASTILCFVSTNLEIDTHRFIIHSLNLGKKVAVPRCTDKNGNMSFFVITSFADLEKGAYGLLEPNLKNCKKLTDYANSICIIPGFAFDSKGYRIGFGKGFYDRFLKGYTGTNIGICYNQCIVNKIPNGRYDIACDYIITEKYIMTCNKKHGHIDL